MDSARDIRDELHYCWLGIKLSFSCIEPECSPQLVSLLKLQNCSGREILCK